jgi:hypothetical protein
MILGKDELIQSQLLKSGEEVYLGLAGVAETMGAPSWQAEQWSNRKLIPSEKVPAESGKRSFRRFPFAAIPVFVLAGDFWRVYGMAIGEAVQAAEEIFKQVDERAKHAATHAARWAEIHAGKPPASDRNEHVGSIYWMRETRKVSFAQTQVFGSCVDIRIDIERIQFRIKDAMDKAMFAHHLKQAAGAL